MRCEVFGCGNPPGPNETCAMMTESETEMTSNMNLPIASTDRRRPASGGAARGFSLVELLIVIAVIAILIGIVVVASKGLFGTAQSSQTKVLLQGLQGMLDEGEGAKIFSRPPVEWVWVNPAAPTMPVIATSSLAAPQAGLDFWKVPYIDTAVVPVQPMALRSPGAVLQGTFGAYGSTAIINTQVALQLLSSVPVNGKALAALPSGRVRTFVWESRAGDPDVWYPRGLRIAVVKPDQSLFRLIVNSSGSVRPVTPPVVATSSYQAVPDGVPVAPLVLDAWNNPMIFVPASGLNVATGAAPGVVVKSPSGKPFFASAGPDGNFSTGEDNIYSFEP